MESQNRLQRRVRLPPGHAPIVRLLVTSKDKLDLPRSRHTVDGLQRQIECLIQNLADCFLGRDEPPKHSESHDDVDRFDAISIKIRDAVCP